MQDFGAKNKLYSYYFSFWSKRLLFAGYCELNFEVGQLCCVGALEITINYFFCDLLAYVAKKQ